MLTDLLLPNIPKIMYKVHSLHRVTSANPGCSKNWIDKKLNFDLLVTLIFFFFFLIKLYPVGL